MRIAFATLLLSPFLASFSLANVTVVAPFAASPDYISKGTLIGPKSGPYRAAFTTRFTGDPVVASRALSVHPDSSLNRELDGAHAPRLGPRALPPVFGGYTMVVYGMKEPAPFTTRAQFHENPSQRNDFINLNVYVESDQPQPPGLEFSYTSALLFHAGDGGAPRIVPLEKIAHASFFMASQRSLARVARVLVRDADSGDFYVSEYSTNENRANLSLAGCTWAKIDPADLTLLGDYRPAPFQRVDHIGVYATVPVTALADALPAYGVICNVALHSFEYGLLP